MSPINYHLATGTNVKYPPFSSNFKSRKSTQLSVRAKFLAALLMVGVLFCFGLTCCIRTFISMDIYFQVKEDKGQFLLITKIVLASLQIIAVSSSLPWTLCDQSSLPISAFVACNNPLLLLLSLLSQELYKVHSANDNRSFNLLPCLPHKGPSDLVKINHSNEEACFLLLVRPYVFGVSSVSPVGNRLHSA